MTAMALARRQKVLIAVFLLGLVGLVVDRVFLRPQGGPGAASADSSDSYAVPPSPAPGGPSATAGAPGPSVAERLSRVWPDREPNTVQARDPFSLTGSWLGGKATGPSAAPDPAQVFAQAHSLGALVVDGRRSNVLINDRVLKLGETIDGYTLVVVKAKSATFECQGQRVVLELLSK